MATDPTLQINAPFPYNDPMVEVRKETDKWGADRLVGYITQEWTTWQNGNQQIVNGGPIRLQSINHPDLDDALTITALLNVTSEGVYRYAHYVQIITPDAVSNSIQVTVTWTYNAVVQTRTFTAVTGITTTTYQSDGLPSIHCDGGSTINISTTYASNTPNACIYSLDASVELLQTVN